MRSLITQFIDYLDGDTLVFHVALKEYKSDTISAIKIYK